jgi:hypothetical protein
VKFSLRTLIAIVAAAVIAAPAAAQDRPPMPAKQLPVMPQFNEMQQVQQKPSTALVLPPSRPCTAADMVGLWKMMQVYEAPAGIETEAFKANPTQYIYFQPNNVYGRYNAAGPDMSYDQVRDEIAHHAAGLQQYVVQDSGFLFYYQDKIPTDTQACFIVVTAKDPFVVGQALLLPPKGQIQGRLVKGYLKVWKPAGTVTPKTTTAK